MNTSLHNNVNNKYSKISIGLISPEIVLAKLYRSLFGLYSCCYGGWKFSVSICCQLNYESIFVRKHFECRGEIEKSYG